MGELGELGHCTGGAIGIVAYIGRVGRVGALYGGYHRNCGLYWESWESWGTVRGVTLELWFILGELGHCTGVAIGIVAYIGTAGPLYGGCRSFICTFSYIDFYPLITINYSSFLDSSSGVGLLCEVSSSHSDTSYTGRVLWTSDQPFGNTSTWQHTTLTKDIYSSRGI